VYQLQWRYQALFLKSLHQEGLVGQFGWCQKGPGSVIGGFYDQVVWLDGLMVVVDPGTYERNLNKDVDFF